VQTGIGEGVLKQMLPLVAALMMGSMARQSRQAPAATGTSGSGTGTDFMSMLTPLLDQNRDGSLMDDVTGMLGRFFGNR
jgi:hypothetical protein